MKTPLTHQKSAVKWLISHRERSQYGFTLKGAILADDMGLGKTFTATLVAKVHAKTQNTHAIILSPKSVINNWKQETKEAGVAATIYTWDSMPVECTTETINGKEVTRYKPKSDLPDFVLLADEAHLAQNENSIRGQSFLALARDKRCKAVYPITGTPAKNGRPINMLPLLKAINHHVSINDMHYQEKYCLAGYQLVLLEDKYNDKEKRLKIWKNNQSANLEDLFQHTQNAVLRRTKDECLDLPEKVRSMVEVELNNADQIAYDELYAKQRAEYERRVKEGEISGFADLIVMLTHLRQAASIAKAKYAIPMIEELLEQGRRPVVFTEFKESAELIAKHFGVEALTGETSTTGRAKMVEAFQQGTTPIFVGTIKAGGVGITLTASQDIILVDRPWTPGDTLQTEDRIHRIGQTNTANVWWLRFGHIDQKVDGVIEAKMTNINLLFTGKAEGKAFFSDVAESVYAMAA